MQQISGYPTNLDVTVPSAAVTVNGVERTVSRASIQRELPGTLMAGDGLVAATSSLEWSQLDDVQTRAASPWDAGTFPPKPGEALTLDMGYEGALARQLTGVLDTAPGSLDGTLTATAVDLIDKLNRPVTFPPQMNVMPPWEEGGPFLQSNNGPLFTTDRVLRACGFYATPPAESGAVLSVPLMGSAWPEIGRLDSAQQVGSPTFPPSFSVTQWGLGANSISANYTPIQLPAGNNRIDTKSFQITMKVRNVSPGGGSNVTDVSAWWGANRIRLRVGPNREIQAIVNEGLTQAFVLSMSVGAAWTADQFTLRVTPGGSWTIYANNGANVTTTRAIYSEFANTGMNRVEIAGSHLSSAHIGGVQVSFYTRDTYNAPTTAVLTPAASNQGLQATPAINGRIALDVLKEQAAAECAAMWIDEFGVFRWVNRDLLTSSDPVATLTALDDLLDISWSSDSKDIRSGVTVKSRAAKIIRFPVSSVTLYVGSGEALQSGQTTTDVVSPPDDESWFNLNLDGGTHTQLNRGEGSMWGGIVSKDNTPDVWAFDANKLTVTVERINSENAVITSTAGALGAGETIVLKTSETDPLLKTFRRDKPLPIIRGKGKVRWTDLVTTSAITGPAGASHLEHDAGFWVQDATALQALADYIASNVTAARPMLQEMPVVADPRRQLGDIVWIDAPGFLNVRLRVLVTGINMQFSAGNLEQSISGRILEVQQLGATNAQLDAHAAARTNSNFDSLWADATNAALDAAPLGRG